MIAEQPFWYLLSKHSENDGQCQRGWHFTSVLLLMQVFINVCGSNKPLLLLLIQSQSASELDTNQSITAKLKSHEHKGLAPFFSSFLFSIQPAVDNHWTQTKNNHRYLFSLLESLEEMWRNCSLGYFKGTQRHCIASVFLCLLRLQWALKLLKQIFNWNTNSNSYCCC